MRLVGLKRCRLKSNPTELDGPRLHCKCEVAHFAHKSPLVVLLLLLSSSTSFISQVLDWIENHGEAFLSKHTGVGKSLHRARALQKRHEDFEEVAQVRRRTTATFYLKSTE